MLFSQSTRANQTKRKMEKQTSQNEILVGHKLRYLGCLPHVSVLKLFDPGLSHVWNPEELSL